MMDLARAAVEAGSGLGDEGDPGADRLLFLEQLGVDEIGVALERLPGGVDEGLGLVA